MQSLGYSGCPTYIVVFSQWIELTLTLTLTLILTLTHRKYTNDCPLMPSDVTGVKWLKKHSNVYLWVSPGSFHGGKLKYTPNKNKYTERMIYRYEIENANNWG